MRARLLPVALTLLLLPAAPATSSAAPTAATPAGTPGGASAQVRAAAGRVARTAARRPRAGRPGTRRRSARRTPPARLTLGRTVGGLPALAALLRPAAPVPPRPAVPGPATPVVPAVPVSVPAPGAAVAAAVQTVGQALVPAPPPPPPAAPPAPGPAPSTLGVQVDETPAYTMVLSRPEVAAGSVRIQLQNVGEDGHNALLTRADGDGEAIVFALTEPGRTTSRTVTLDAGAYRLVCTLAAPVVHETAGMRAAFTVLP